MEIVRREAMRQLSELPVGIHDESYMKSKFTTILEGAFDHIQWKMDNGMQGFLTNENENKLQEMFHEIKDVVFQFGLFCDVGIYAFNEAVNWFKQSVQNYEVDKSNLQRVNVDVSRLLSTFKNQVESKFKLCTFPNNEYAEFQKIAKPLTEAVYSMKSKLVIAENSIMDHSNEELNENIYEVGIYATDMMFFLKKVQDQQRKIVDEKMNYDLRIEKWKPEPPKFGSFEDFKPQSPRIFDNFDGVKATKNVFEQSQRSYHYETKAQSYEAVPPKIPKNIFEDFNSMKPRHILEDSENRYRSFFQDTHANNSPDIKPQIPNYFQNFEIMKPSEVIEAARSAMRDMNIEAEKFINSKSQVANSIANFEQLKPVPIPTEVPRNNFRSYSTEESTGSGEAGKIIRGCWKRSSLHSKKVTFAEKPVIHEIANLKELSQMYEEMLSEPLPEHSNNMTSFTGTIRHRIKNISNLGSNGSETKTVMIGDIPWKLQACNHSPGQLLFVLHCEWKDRYLPWHCFAKSEIRFLNRFNTGPCYSKNVTFSSDNSHTFFVVMIDDILKPELINDKITVEVDVTLLSYSCIPREECSFTNTDYAQTTGVINHVIRNVSRLDDGEDSEIVNIGGYRWKLSFSTNPSNRPEYMAAAVNCNWDDYSTWSCKAKAQIFIFKKSNIKEFYSRTIAGEMNGENRHILDYNFVKWDELMNPNNDYVRNNEVVIQAVITIFRN